MHFFDLRRTLLGGYRREDVLCCYQNLMRRHRAEVEQLNGLLEARDTFIRELSEENEALHLRNRRLEERAEQYEKITQRL